MALSPSQLADKWINREFTAANYDKIDESYLKRFAEDLSETIEAASNPNGAVYLRLRNGKTLWHLGTEVRDKTKLWLRKFGTGTLPAILPAPVLDPNRPSIGAPGTPFSLHPTIGGPATGPAAIAEYTRQVSDGGQFLLTGADLDQAKYPVYQGGNFYATSVTGQHSQRASVRLPRIGAAWDATLTWASTAAGISEPVLLNTAVLLWGQEQTVVGLTFSIYGRNLAHGNVAGGASYLAVQPVGGGAVRLLTGTAVDAYNADFVTPNLANGDYYYWPHNGHGGDFGWGERGVITVVAAENHVKTRSFGAPVYVKLDKNDAAGNVATINAAFVQYRHFCTDDDTFPINAQLYPRDKTKWSCVSLTGRTVLRATTWDPKSQYLGMFGSNSWYMGVLERISFLDPDDHVPYKTKPGFYNQSLIDLRRATGSSGNEHIWLKDVEATWIRPYYEVNMGTYSIPEEAQCLHVEGARHFFVDNARIIGSGSHFGNSGQVFIENYWHRLRNGADHTLYGLHVNGFSVKGFDFQDHNPTSGDGVTRGAGRGPKFGGQGGSNQNTYLRDLNGRLLGPLFTGINPYFDRNQGEMCLYEGNRVVWQNMVVSATATTITFAGPVLSNPAAVANGTSSPDKPAVGVLPDYHLLWIGRGRGIDQVRGIVSVNGNTITLDKPLRVIPDATSFVQVGTFTRGNTLSKVRLTGKRSIVDDILFGIQCAINFYGGMFDTIADDFEVTDTRHGFIFTPTVHADGQIDTVAFCQMLNSKFNGQRWVERYESYGKEEELFWSFGCSGLRNILVANIEATNWLEARVVFKVVRQAAELAAYWRTDAPPIDGLVRDNMPVVANILNDYRTPAGPANFPPIPLAAGVVAGFVQSPVQVQVLPSAPGVQLVAGDELGPLEPLPAGAGIDPKNGVLSYNGTDPAVLVYVNGAQEIPLDRTPVAGLATGGTTTPPSSGGSAVMHSDHYEVKVAGLQPAITQSGATYFFNVTVAGVELVRDVDYTDDGQGTLTILNLDPSEIGEEVQYYWLTGPVTSGPSPGPAPAPGVTYTAGNGINITAGVISATLDAYTKLVSDQRFGQLAVPNTWDDANTFTRYAEFTSTYLPGKVQISAFGIAITFGAAATNIDGNGIQFTDGTGGTGRVSVAGGVLKLNAAVATEVAQEPTTPQGIASKSYVDRLAGVLVRNSSVVKLDRNSEHAPLSSGTFTVDLTGRVVGVEAVVYLGPASTDPALPATTFQLISGAYAPGVDLMYTLKAGANGKVQYVITELP